MSVLILVKSKMIFPFKQFPVPVSLIRLETSAVIVVMAVFLPFRTDLIHKVSDDAIGVLVLEVSQIAVNAVKEMAEH